MLYDASSARIMRIQCVCAPDVAALQGKGAVRPQRPVAAATDALAQAAAACAAEPGLLFET